MATKDLKKISREIEPTRFPKLLVDTGVERVYDEDIERAIEIQLHDSVPEGKTTLFEARLLMDEYECRTASEKAMAQVAANAFARILENSRILSGYSMTEYADQLRINFYSMIGKELDRATRQFDAAISSLMRMKMPTMKVNVTAKTAFVANNQQFNANYTNHENIKAN